MPSTKIQRWLDLLAALLARRAPATFVELARDVPAYATPSDTVKRMFERDKVELRELGVPILSVGEEGDDEIAYQLRSKDFYLPYLAIMSERGLDAPEKVDRYGYRSLVTLAFAPDELEAIRDGAHRVMQIGDASLTDDTRHALQKLAFDLPLGATDNGGSDGAIVPPTARLDPKLLSTLADALFRRKQTTFNYRSMGRSDQESRTVEPYGLFFLDGHWYLAARDIEKDGIRNFRVSRIVDAKVNAKRSETPDYDLPASFKLRDHARSRLAWEIGEGEATETVVEFRGDNGAVRAAAALGREASGANFASRGVSKPLGARQFDIRRIDNFARWLLAFGGDALPLSPPELVNEYRALIERTQAVYR